MPKVILIGSQQTQWNIEGSYKPGGIPIFLTEEEINKHQDVVLNIVNEDGTLSKPEFKEIPKQELPKKPKPKVSKKKVK